MEGITKKEIKRIEKEKGFVRALKILLVLSSYNKVVTSKNIEGITDYSSGIVAYELSRLSKEGFAVASYKDAYLTNPHREIAVVGLCSITVQGKTFLKEYLKNIQKCTQ